MTINRLQALLLALGLMLVGIAAARAHDADPVNSEQVWAGTTPEQYVSQPDVKLLR